MTVIASDPFVTPEQAATLGVELVAFDEGALTGNVRPETTFPEGDFRARCLQGIGGCRSRAYGHAFRHLGSPSVCPSEQDIDGVHG